MLLYFWLPDIAWTGVVTVDTSQIIVQRGSSAAGPSSEFQDASKWTLMGKTWGRNATIGAVIAGLDANHYACRSLPRILTPLCASHQSMNSYAE